MTIRTLPIDILKAGAIALSLAFVNLAGNARAQEVTAADALFEAMRIGDLLAVMQEEGLKYGHDVADEMLGGRPPEWAALVASLYDPVRMEAAVRAGLAAAVAEADVSGAIAFFESETGRAFLELEISARQAMLDPDIDAAAREAAVLAIADEAPRYQLLSEYVAANDLIDTNVSSAMNANFAFFLGLMEGGALPPEVTEERLLEDLWRQEAELRGSSTEWLYAFLLMAYSPASDADIAAYIAFSETPAGRLVNRALFIAFDGMFQDISRGLGLAAARYMVTREL